MATPEDTIFVPDDHPVVVEATKVVQEGDLAKLDALLDAHPWLITAHFGDPTCHRTLLHAATDFPGNYPNGPDVVRRLVGAGLDVNARSLFDGFRETPLHWAASSDDIPVLDALLDAGADLEADGGVLSGGTALADACEAGNWEIAQRLLERGARTRLQDAAALGAMDRLRSALDGAAVPDGDALGLALWWAAAAGEEEAAGYLVDRGAGLNWQGGGAGTPLDAAERAEESEMVAWLRSRGGQRAAELN